MKRKLKRVSLPNNRQSTGRVEELECGKFKMMVKFISLPKKNSYYNSFVIATFRGGSKINLPAPLPLHK